MIGNALILVSPNKNTWPTKNTSTEPGRAYLAEFMQTLHAGNPSLIPRILDSPLASARMTPSTELRAIPKHSGHGSQTKTKKIKNTFDILGLCW